jgi:uncharacterized protein YlxP (DUF503 family)
MTNINDHIQRDRDELSDPMISSQRRRHVEEELDSLEKYHANHPEDEHDPSSLELFCDQNPNASECKVYDL